MNDKINYRSDKKTEVTRSKYGTPVQHDFGIRDAKGRALGTLISLYTVTVVEITEAEIAERKAKSSGWCPCSWEPGTFFGVHVHTTRNRIGFGAAFNGAVLKTEADRDAYIATYLKDAKKRALKNEGK